MKFRFNLVFAWLVYAGLLVFVSGAYRFHWLLIVDIALGSLFGLLLPALACALGGLLDTERVVVNLALIKVFISRMWHDYETQVPVTRIGKTIYSYPFLFAFGLLALYIVTSSSSWFGKALVLGLGLKLVFDLLISSRDRVLFLGRWFGLFKANLSKLEESVLVFGSLFFWLILTILAVKN